MTVVCFSGPSLTPSAAQREFSAACCLPPAAQGDVYRACVEHRPSAICLIDGYFEHRPAVSHKELLWALSEGIAVYGAASMGALRALELAPHGMHGIGAVYRLYASHEIDGDDEVAVLHADASLDYRVGSDALVNIRATLAVACAQRVLSQRSCAALIAQARITFYAERSYERLLSSWPASARKSERRALAAWLRASGRRIDLKRRDALELVRHVRAAWRAGTLAKPSRKVEFHTTDAWTQIQRAALEQGPQNDNATDDVTAEELLEEAQLAGPATFDEVVRVATWRALCLALRSGTRDGLDLHGESERLSEDATVDALSSTARRHVTGNVPGALRVLQLYDSLAERARAKRRLRRRSTPSMMEAVSLLKMYSRLRRVRIVPHNVDACAERVGFSDRVAFLRALAVEVAYLQEMRATLR